MANPRNQNTARTPSRAATGSPSASPPSASPDGLADLRVRLEILENRVLQLELMAQQAREKLALAVEHFKSMLPPSMRGMVDKMLERMNETQGQEGQRPAAAVSGNSTGGAVVQRTLVAGP